MLYANTLLPHRSWSCPCKGNSSLCRASVNERVVALAIVSLGLKTNPSDIWMMVGVDRAGSRKHDESEVRRVSSPVFQMFRGSSGARPFVLFNNPRRQAGWKKTSIIQRSATESIVGYCGLLHDLNPLLVAFRRLS